jgi:hypothetical protein
VFSAHIIQEKRKGKTIFPGPTRSLTLKRMLHIELEIGNYEEDAGRLPNTLAEVPELAKWNKVIPASDMSLEDEWGRAIMYTKRTNKYELTSAGQDGLFGTPDDLRDIAPALGPRRFGR